MRGLRFSVFWHQNRMPILRWAVLLLGCAPLAAAQATPIVSQARPDTLEASSSRELAGKVGLVRGVLKKLDPIHDTLFVRTFGGGEVRISFDERTSLLQDNGQSRLLHLPSGSIVSVDTVIDNGKLFARSVRTGAPGEAELSGQVVEFNRSKSLLTLSDSLSPKNISVHLATQTKITSQGQAVLAEAISTGMLVRVSFSPVDDMAREVEILAKPGSIFAFQGKVVAVDLRTGTLTLSNDTDQSLRELAFGPLDTGNRKLLSEGSDVSIQAEFDGRRYFVRSITAAPASR